MFKSIRNSAISLLGAAIMALTPVCAHAENVYLPLVTNQVKRYCNVQTKPSACDEGISFTACVNPIEYSCSTEDPIIFVDYFNYAFGLGRYRMVYPKVELFEDGSVLIDIDNFIFGACAYPDRGCTPDDNGQYIHALDNGTVEFYYGL